ncbi:peptidase m12a astacin [Moniliophthora roreri]|nr:peptidase m12a astacin [Moniliophthora roreri]
MMRPSCGWREREREREKWQSGRAVGVGRILQVYSPKDNTTFIKTHHGRILSRVVSFSGCQLLIPGRENSGVWGTDLPTEMLILRLRTEQTPPVTRVGELKIFQQEGRQRIRTGSMLCFSLGGSSAIAQSLSRRDDQVISRDAV